MQNTFQRFHGSRSAEPGIEVLLSLLPGRRKHVEVRAVDDEGLKALLERLGVLESLGKDARCSVCGNVVTLESISAVYPEDGKVRFICSNGKCAASVVSSDG
jgi:hypothetical protein